MFQPGFQISIYLPGMVECGVWDGHIYPNGTQQVFVHRDSYMYTRTKLFKCIIGSSVLQGSPNLLDILKRIGVTEIRVELAGQALDKVVASKRTTLSEEQIDVGAARSR